MNFKRNPPRRAALIWAGILAAGIVVVLVPTLADVRGTNTGLAISFLGGFIILIALVAAIIYARLAALLDRVTGQEQLLAHWTLPPGQMQKPDRLSAKALSNPGLLTAAVIVCTAVVAVVVLAFERSQIWLIAIIAATFCVCTGVAVWFTTRANRPQNALPPGEVFIALDGAYVNCKLHIWNGIGNKLENELYTVSTGQPPALSFEYTVPTEDGRESRVVNIPVPAGLEAEARDLIARITAARLRKQI